VSLWADYTCDVVIDMLDSLGVPWETVTGECHDDCDGEVLCGDRSWATGEVPEDTVATNLIHQ
jgi:hypothetical protein